MTPTRDPRRIAHGLTFLAAASLVWLGVDRGGWWELCWLAALCAGLAGGSDLADGVTRRVRDTATDTKDTP